MVAPAGAGPWPQITLGDVLPASQIITGTSPPGPHRCGSTTCRVKAIATPASKALPPRSSTPIPTAVPIQCVDATTPKVPSISGRVVKGPALMLAMGVGAPARRVFSVYSDLFCLSGHRAAMANVSGAEMPNCKRFQQSAEPPVLHNQATEHVALAEPRAVSIQVTRSKRGPGGQMITQSLRDAIPGLGGRADMEDVVARAVNYVDALFFRGSQLSSLSWELLERRTHQIVEQRLDYLILFSVRILDHLWPSRTSCPPVNINDPSCRAPAPPRPGSRTASAPRPGPCWWWRRTAGPPPPRRRRPRRGRRSLVQAPGPRGC